jgi:hypothetical protein
MVPLSRSSAGNVTAGVGLIIHQRNRKLFRFQGNNNAEARDLKKNVAYDILCHNNLHVPNVKLQSNIIYELTKIKGSATWIMLNLLPFLMHVIHSPSSKHNLCEVENGVAPFCSCSKRFVYSPRTKGK